MASAPRETIVGTAGELLSAIVDGHPYILVSGPIDGLPPITLAPDQTIEGDADAVLRFTGEGIGLTRNNRLQNLPIASPAQNRAVYLGEDIADRGRLELEDVVCNGQIALIFTTPGSTARIMFNKVMIADADATVHSDRPFGNGVALIQGAITI